MNYHDHLDVFEQNKTVVYYLKFLLDWNEIHPSSLFIFDCDRFDQILSH